MANPNDGGQVRAVTSIPSGLCAVYKPPGWSSSDVVMKVKNILRSEYTERTGERIKLKVGHGGTLDPLAEGVLVLGVGSGTKLMNDYLSGSKGYRASALLGTAMDTLDSTGNVTRTMDCSHVTKEMLDAALPQFRGDILQMPPMFSALKRNGKKLYELAREGIEVERESRPVTVYSLETGDCALPHFDLHVECSGGFYVRSLIDDLSVAVAGAGHMTALVRTKQGSFTVEDSLREDKWDFDEICKHIVKCSEMVGIPADKIGKS